MGKLGSMALSFKYLVYDIAYVIKYYVSYVGYTIAIVTLPGLIVFTLGILFYVTFLVVGWYLAFTMLFPKHSEKFIKENLLDERFSNDSE